MRCYEFMARTKKVLDVQPSAVQKQRRIAQVVNQIAASSQQQPPSDDEKMLAQLQFADMQSQADAAYTTQLKNQLERIEAQKPKAKVSGRELR